MKRLLLVLAAAALLPLAGGACAHAPAFAPVQTTTVGTPVARVDLQRVDGNIVKLLVYNTSTGQMVIDRNDVLLQTPEGTAIEREPGGARNLYTVEPGGFHKVFVRFKRRDLPAGTIVHLLVDPAVRINGQCVGIPPMPLMVQ